MYPFIHLLFAFYNHQMLERLAKLREESKGGESDEDEDDGEDEDVGKEGEGSSNREHSSASARHFASSGIGDEKEEEKGDDEKAVASFNLAMPRPDVAIAELETTLGYTPRSNAPDSPDSGEDYVVVEEDDGEEDD